MRKNNFKIMCKKEYLNHPIWNLFIQELNKHGRSLGGNSIGNWYGLINGEVSIKEDFYEEGLNVCEVTSLKGLKKLLKLKTKHNNVKYENYFTKAITLNNSIREVTIATIVSHSNVVAVGYSVKHPKDKGSLEISNKVAKGRALEPKTSLMRETLPEKFIDKNVLKGIAEMVWSKISKGEIKLKGVNF